MNIEIKSELPFSQYKFDLAYGRVKRFLSTEKKVHVYLFNGFAVTIKRKSKSVVATIKNK
tara:strand:- start:1319 stop:1498 length:180 start_codon:yes stop_codon:yes gene_type:complete